MINQICDMVHKDQFNQCMVSLALRDPPESSATPNDTATGGAIAPPPPAPGRYAQVRAAWFYLASRVFTKFYAKLCQTVTLNAKNS